MPRHDLAALQASRLQALVRRVDERVPFYRQAFERAGVRPEQIRTLADIRRLPWTRKTDLRDHYPFGLFAVPRDQVVRLHASSGTTGKPTVVGYTRGDVQVWAEVCARCLAAGGGRPGDVFHNAYGYGLFTGGLGMHYGAELMGMTVVPVSGGNTERQLLLIQDFQPRVIACTPSYMLTLAAAARAGGGTRVHDPHQRGASRDPLPVGGPRIAGPVAVPVRANPRTDVPRRRPHGRYADHSRDQCLSFAGGVGGRAVSRTIAP